MFAYIVRRLLYAPLILIGVNLLTFALFFVVNTPTTWRACSWAPSG
jgi:peptide/nickel transport system permease protein